MSLFGDGGRVPEDGGQTTEGGGSVGGGLTLKVFRKHIKRLVNYAEAGDGGKIREELKRIVPEYRPEDGGRRTDDGGQMIHHRDTEGTEKKEKDSVSPWYILVDGGQKADE